MKVVLFLPSFLPEIGGLEIAADSFAQQLVTLGHEVVVFAQRPRKKLGRIEKPYPITHYKRPRSTTLFPFSVESALKRLHRQFDFDIIHAHHAYLPGYIAVRFGRRHNIPVVISCRGGDIDTRGRYRKRWMSRKRIIWALKHADAVTALSKHLAQQVYVLTNNSVAVHVIPNGVGIMNNNFFTDLSLPAFAHLENDAFMLTLGRLHRVKGVDLLLDAIRLLKDKNSTMPILVIAGDGKEKSRLLQQVDTNNLGDCVTFVGQVSGAKKAWLLANCGFLVQPSRSEGLPNAVLEAMAYGKPVLSTSVGGQAELISNGENGFLVEPENAQALAHGLKCMLDADIPKFLPAAKKIAEKHTWANAAAAYVRLYKSIAHRPSA